jgi:hypothetical protein
MDIPPAQRSRQLPVRGNDVGCEDISGAVGGSAAADITTRMVARGGIWFRDCKYQASEPAPIWPPLPSTDPENVKKRTGCNPDRIRMIMGPFQKFMVANMSRRSACKPAAFCSLPVLAGLVFGAGSDCRKWKASISIRLSQETTAR